LRIISQIIFIFAMQSFRTMNRLKEFLHKYFFWVNAYWIVIFVFIILFLVPSDSSLYNRVKYDEKIRSLEKEVQTYKNEIAVNKEKLYNLQTDKNGLERFAREEYFMKRDSEDVFIIKEKK
jgi:cell division protein DivIC